MGRNPDAAVIGQMPSMLTRPRDQFVELIHRIAKSCLPRLQRGLPGPAVRIQYRKVGQADPRRRGRRCDPPRQFAKIIIGCSVRLMM